MPETDGIRATVALASVHAGPLVVTPPAFDDSERIVRAIRCHASTSVICPAARSFKHGDRSEDRAPSDTR
jgi:hypothetical protein